MIERRQLISWKEISQYLGYGVRTVQRYEESFGLPIHRPAGRARTSVLAFTDELEFWLRSTPRRRDARPALDDGQPGAERIPVSAAKSDLRDELRLAEEDLKRAITEYERCLARYHRVKQSASGAGASQELKKMSLAS